MNTRLSLCLYALGAGTLAVGPCAFALEKEISLVTKQALGDLAVAGRLSIDLHAEFMLSRSWGTETALNWYNCGYSGGGRGGTTVGGTFGDFGFQVPYEQRELQYPHAATLGQVPAVHFDGGDFLKGNIPIEKKILESGNLALEVWLQCEAVPDKAMAILGWQSANGSETSGSLGIPPRFEPSKNWRHLVVNCTSAKEEWFLDGVKVVSGPRRMTLKEDHVMVLGGVSEAKPSFRGHLAAVRLHDETLTGEEIAHNFKGGVMLGTALQNWWRMEPDKWWVKESEHFRHCVDKDEMKAWTPKQLEEFNGRVPGMFILAELIYRSYSQRQALRSSVVSLQPAERGDGIKYKTPIQPSNGSWMGFDEHFGWACQGAGFINPHELVHGWQTMTGNMAGNYWEAHANFPQTYAGIYQTVPVITAEASAFPASGRTYYHDRLMFEHLAQTPEYGPMFISKLWYDGPTAEVKSPYPWITFTRLNPFPERSLADEFARMAMRNVTWDYQNFQESPPAQAGNTPFGNDAVPSSESIYRRMAESNKQDGQRSLLRSWIQLQPIAYEAQWWRVPKEQAPQQLGWNICPLTCKPGRVTALLEGYVDAKRGGDWRGGFVGVGHDGKPVYGKIFGPGQPAEFDVSGDTKELYLVVCATPSNIVDIPMTGDFRSFEQEPFPYKVKLQGCQPLDVLEQGKAAEEGAPHKNGGGFVAKTAQVDATAYVGSAARVLGNSKVLNEARIEDQAVVQNATVKDQACVSGHALVMENSTISGRAKVRDHAVVKGQTTVTDNARILEHAVIFTQKTCSGDVTVKGIASVYGGNQSGTAMIDGFYAKGNEISGGKWFTWSWGQGKNPGEEETNLGGLYAEYDFNTDHGWMARDSFGTTWGYLVNGPKVEPRSDKTAGGEGALRLNGKDQFVELPRDVADLGDCTYTAEFLWDGAAEGGRIFEFGNAEGDMICLTPCANGKMVFAMRHGKVLESVMAPAARKNTWTSVQVIIAGHTVSLFVNGTKAAEKSNLTLRPESIRATQCYLGRGLQGGFFGGAIGKFTIHAVALIDRSPPTPNPPSFELPPMFTSPGSVSMTAKTGADPLGVVEYWFEEEGGRWNSGWIKETNVRLEERNAARPALYRFKMRDKGGNETAYSQPVRSTGFSSETRVVDVSPDGPAVVEAEHFIASLPAADGTTRWEKRGDPAGFVGEGYMAVPDRGMANDPFKPTAARLDYALNFAKAGRYFIWVRGNGNNDGGQAIHVGLDLKVADWGRNLRTGTGRYAWTRSPVFEVSKAGSYLFSIWMHQDGAMVDRFIVTGKESYEPTPDQRASDKVMTGEGPAESPPFRK